VAAAICLPCRGERGSGTQPRSEDQKIIWEQALAQPSTRLMKREQLLKAAGSSVDILSTETAEHQASSSKLRAELMHSMPQMNMAGAKKTQMLR